MQIMGNTDKIVIVIKTIAFILITYYCNFKLTNKRININFRIIIEIIATGILGGIIKNEINYLISTIISVILVSIIFSKSNFVIGVLTTIISLSINYGIELIAIFISFMLNKPFRINNDYIRLSTIIILHIFIVYKIFKIKKFR